MPTTATALSGLPGARGPILVLVGKDDHVVDRVAREQVAAALRTSAGGHALVTYPGTGHGYLAPTRAAYSAGAAADSWRRIVRHLIPRE